MSFVRDFGTGRYTEAPMNPDESGKFPRAWRALFKLSFIRFLAVGVLNTAVGLSVIFAAKALLGWGDLAANAFGYAIGLMVSFMLNRSWTFGHSGAVAPAVLRFIMVFLVAYGLNLAAVFTLRDWVGINAYLAHVGGIVPYTVFFYFGSRRFVFPLRPAMADTTHSCEA